MLSFHIAFATWTAAHPDLERSKDRDMMRWAVADDVSASWERGGDADPGYWRSRAAECFLRLTDKEVFVMIDHDQAWEAGDIERLVSAAQQCRGVVAAAISKKSFSAGLASVPMPGHTIEPRVDKVIPARTVGAGFVAIHRDALEALQGVTTEVVSGGGDIDSFRTYFYPLLADAGDVPGAKVWARDDVAFGMRCRAAGVPMYIDCKPYVTHIGSYAWTIDDALKAEAKDR